MFHLYQSEIESYKYPQIKYQMYLTNTQFFIKYLANAQIQRELRKVSRQGKTF